MVRYLSDEWLARAGGELAALPPLDVPVVVGFVVTGGPEGDRRYSVRLGPERVGLVPGTDAAVVVLAQTWDTARAVLQGQRSAQQAFLDGDIRLEGDVRVLLGHQSRLAAVDDHLASLRADTTF